MFTLVARSCPHAEEPLQQLCMLIWYFSAWYWFSMHSPGSKFVHTNKETSFNKNRNKSCFTGKKHFFLAHMCQEQLFCCVLKKKWIDRNQLEVNTYRYNFIYLMKYLSEMNHSSLIYCFMWCACSFEIQQIYF
jgi:hypothetical protein